MENNVVVIMAAAAVLNNNKTNSEYYKGEQNLGSLQTIRSVVMISLYAMVYKAI